MENFSNASKELGDQIVGVIVDSNFYLPSLFSLNYFSWAYCLLFTRFGFCSGFAQLLCLPRT